jgi:hypothetical protein
METIERHGHCTEDSLVAQILGIVGQLEDQYETGDLLASIVLNVQLLQFQPISS